MADYDAAPLLVLALGVCFAASAWYLVKSALKRRGAALRPPSPPALPLLGHLHLLSNLPHQPLYQLSKRYGPFMYLQLGNVPAVVVSSAELAKEVLQTQGHAFSSRPRLSLGVYSFYDCSDVLCAPQSAYWKQMRQLCVMELFGAKRTTDFKTIRGEERARLARRVWEEATHGRSFELRRQLMLLSSSVICRMAVGRRFAEMETAVSAASFTDIIAEISRLVGKRCYGDFLPYLRWMDFFLIREMKASARKSDAVLQGIVDGRRARYKAQLQASPAPVPANSDQLSESDADANSDHAPAKKADLLDLLLSLQKTDASITDDNIKAILYDMFAAGTDSSAITVEWAMAELLRNPQELKKLQAELDAVIGKERLLEEADVAELPFLRAVVKEGLRMHPPAPLMFPHESTQACEVAGYHIPARTRVMVNIWAIGREEKSWERPHEFRPDRFIGSDIDVRGHHFELLPFGAGRRGCPGWTLGLLTVQASIGMLVHAFDWSATPASTLDMTEKYGLSVGKGQRLVVTATPRLPAHVYELY